LLLQLYFSSFYLFPFHIFRGVGVGLTSFFEYFFLIHKFQGNGFRGHFLVTLHCIFCYSANSRGWPPSPLNPL
jgi:hypothetical protein